MKNNIALSNNYKLLKRYKMTCINKGLTEKSIEAICDNDLRLFLEFINDKPLEEVDHNDIQDFMLYCSEDRQNGDEALARKFNSLNMFFKTLIKQEALNIKNPMDRLEKPKKRKKQRGYLTFDEYNRILDYLEETNNLRDAALYAFFYASGCRLTEVYQQDRDSLDYESKRFKVLGKGEKERICVFNKDSAERIKRYLDTRTDDIPALFISRQNNRLSKKAIQDAVKNAAKKAGIKKNVHPHILRHTRAMHLLQKGAKLETIQRLLGHESIATTQIYAHMNMDEVQNEVAQIDGDL